MKDLRGLTFGKLTVQDLSPSKTPGGKLRWVCLCACGQTTTVTGSNLSSGNTQACGQCRSPHTPGKRALLAHYNNYRNNAKTKEIDFDITLTRFEELVKSPCYYCGHDPILRDFSNYVGSDYSRRFRTAMQTVVNGIDKVDPTQGYTEANVVACCSDCNYAKHRLSQEAFISLCKRVANKWSAQ